MPSDFRREFVVESIISLSGADKSVQHDIADKDEVAKFLDEHRYLQSKPRPLIHLLTCCALCLSAAAARCCLRMPSGRRTAR